MGRSEEKLMTKLLSNLDSRRVTGPKPPVNLKQCILLGLHLVKEQRLSNGIARRSIYVKDVKGRYLGIQDLVKDVLVDRLIVRHNDLSALWVHQGIGQHLIFDIFKLYRYAFYFCILKLSEDFLCEPMSLFSNDLFSVGVFY